jgi:hypothetical protein
MTETLRDRLISRGVPFRDADPPLPMRTPVVIELSRVAVIDRPIDAANLLRACGLTIAEAKGAVDGLVDRGASTVTVDEGQFRTLRGILFRLGVEGGGP